MLTAPPAAGAVSVNLGTSADFTVLAKSAITTTGSTSIVGNLGISPAAASSMTGFGQILDSSGEFSTSSLVTGKIYAANYAAPTPSQMTVAIGDMETAYNDAAGRSDPNTLNFLSGNLNGETFAAGLHKWTSALTITDSITLDGGGDLNAVWIFQIDNRLQLATGAQIILSNGASAGNVFWQSAEGATLGTNSHFEGNLLTKTDVAVMTGASMNARLLAQTAVTLDSNSITAIPEPSALTFLMGLGILGATCTRRRLKREPA